MNELYDNGINTMSQNTTGLERLLLCVVWLRPIIRMWDLGLQGECPPLKSWAGKIVVVVIVGLRPIARFRWKGRREPRASNLHKFSPTKNSSAN